MSKVSRPATVTVRNPDAVRVFAHEPSVRLLMLFAPKATTVSDVARASDQSTARVFYHVQRFIDCGLLALEHEERRRGRAIRHYRTVADAFVVMTDAIERSVTRGLAEELRSRLDDAATQVGTGKVTFSADATGQVLMDGMSAPGPRSAPTAEFWSTLRLPDDVAAQLARELSELLARYDRLAGSGREFLVHVALVPRDKA